MSTHSAPGFYGLEANPHRLTASRRAPPALERCPDCGQPAVLRHKGRRLVRCAACSLAAVRARKRAYQVAHRAQRNQQRRQGGVPCPPYVAWTVEDCGAAGAIVSRDLMAPDAVCLPWYGACSCGEAGCVHLVVACLAQQQSEGGGDDG